VDRQHVNIQHILASLALKATRQSVIIAKLSSYPRKNRTKKALWELDNLRALKRGESYHKLVRAGRVCQRRQIASQNRSRATALERMLAAAGQLHHLLQCLHPIGIARARRAPAGLPTGRRDQAGLRLPGYRQWGRPPGIGLSLGGSPR
jgi:hypothetical protein